MAGKIRAKTHRASNVLNLRTKKLPIFFPEWTDQIAN